MEILWATLTWLALGLPVGLVFLRQGRPELCLGVLPFAGSLSVMLPMVAAPWLGGSLAAWGWKALLAGLFLAVLAQALLKDGETKTEISSSSQRPLWLVAVALAPLLGIGAYSVFSGIVLSEGPPSYGWDAKQIWLVRTKVLAGSDVFPTRFYTEPQVVRSNWFYPLLLPSNLAWFMKSASLQLRELHIPLGIVAALIPLATFAMLARRVPPLLAAAVALAALAATGDHPVSGVRFLLVMHHQAWVDPLLVMFAIAGCSGAIVGVLWGDRPLAVAGGFALACAVGVKSDGIFWLAAAGSTVFLLLAHLHYPIGRGLRTLLGTLLPSILLFGAWTLTCRRLGIANSVAIDWSDAASRLPAIWGTLWHVIPWGPNAVIIPLCIAAIFYTVPGPAIARVRLALILLSLPLVYLAGIVAIQALIHIPPPFGIQWMVTHSTFRLTLGVVPALFSVATAAASAPRKPARTECPSS